MANGDDKYLKEAQKADYGIRSIFFHRNIKRLDYDKFLKKINRFCHPKVITDDTSLIAYYRGIAGIPIKGIKKVAFDTTRFESGKAAIDHKMAIELSKAINEFISRILEEDREYSFKDSSVMFYATLGANLEGSWRNVKGIEISNQVKRIIYEYFLSRKLIKSVMPSKGKEIKPDKGIPVEEIKNLILTNQYKIEFGSEPDIAFIDKKGILTGMVEVKGGLDEAGALERYGAAKKTFDEVLNKNPRAFTIYLANCITPTVRKRIEADRAVRKIFNLTNVFFDEEEKEAFLNEIRWWMRL